MRRLLTILIFFIVLSFTVQSIAQDSLRVTITDRVFHTWGKIACMVKDGDLAYLATYPAQKLIILDVSDIQNPELVGYTFLAGRVLFDCELVGQLLYVASDIGIQAIDVSEPENPTQLRLYERYDRMNWLRPVNQLEYDGGVFFAVIGDTNLYALSIDEFRAQALGSYVTRNSIHTLEVRDQIGYTATLDELLLLELQAPDNIYALDSLELSSTKMVMTEDNTFLVKIEDDDDPIVRIVDVSEEEIGRVESIEVGERVVDIAASENNLYLLTLIRDIIEDDWGGEPMDCNALKLIDISDIDSPVEVDSIWSIHYLSSWGMFAQDGYLYTGLTLTHSDNRFNIFTYTDEDGFGEVGTIGEKRVDFMTTVSEEDAIALVVRRVERDDTVQLIDFTDPSHPQVLGSISWDSETDIQRPFVNEGFAYIFDQGHHRMRVVDLRNPSDPQQLGDYYSGMTPSGLVPYNMEFYGDYAYVTTRGIPNFHIFDISNMRDITVAGSIRLPGRADLPDAILGVTKYDHYAYVASNSNGFYIIDVADPESPELVNHIRVPEYTGSIVNYEHYLYVNRYDRQNERTSILIYDLSDPVNPEELESVVYEDAIGWLTIADNFAFSGSMIFNLSNPEAPERISYYTEENGYYNADNLSHLWPYVITADSYHTTIYDCSEAMEALNVSNNKVNPHKYNLLSAYPNPFNNQTTAQFYVTTPGRVTIELYDPLGRLVKDLTPAGWLLVGEQRLSINSNRLSTGTYLLKMEQNGIAQSSKLTLIK